MWGDADLRATKAFQEAQGWTGSDADGLPGPGTWRLLVNGTGNDI
ncbi:peptidoglycan-binding protein [Streptomyces pratensis]